MALFPLFYNLHEKKCTIVGGGKVAERKMGVLMDFGANIYIISPDVTQRIRELAGDSKVNVSYKKYEAGDIEDSFLVVCATDDPSVNRQVYEECVQRGVPVNLTDGMKEGSFAFSSIVQRGDIVVGISTSGDFPQLTGHLKKVVYDAIDPALEVSAVVLKEWRRKVLDQNCPEEQKQLFLKAAFDKWLDMPSDNYSQVEYKAMLEKEMARLYEAFFQNESA